ncbi:hypothetical protein [uncultured Alistipes sp.]|uniref:hypothetical protein n=1 Tax=uncultured Alistipes sp. TaxID=538949 RepID=UPI00260C379E|nr:hypothetical protein [uncultured Alistipes sp.]
MESADIRPSQPREDSTNAPLNRAQLIEFLKRSLSRSQECNYEMAEASKLLSSCAGNLFAECESLCNKVIEMYGEIDDQDRELDELYGLSDPDD